MKINTVLFALLILEIIFVTWSIILSRRVNKAYKEGKSPFDGVSNPLDLLIMILGPALPHAWGFYTIGKKPDNQFQKHQFCSSLMWVALSAFTIGLLWGFSPITRNESLTYSAVALLAYIAIWVANVSFICTWNRVQEKEREKKFA